MSDSSLPPPPPLQDPGLIERIHCLWDELAAIEASENESALMHLLRTVAEMIDAQNAYWMEAVQMTRAMADPLCGWRPMVIRYLQPLPMDERFTQRRMRAIRSGEIDESTVAQARLAGTFRAHRLRDIVPAAWYKTEFYQSYRDRGIHDSLTVGVPINAMTEGYYGFLRMREGEPFTEKQLQVAHYAMRGLTWFHRQVLLAHGVTVAGTPLTPRERELLALLLTDRPEKLIAEELGVTTATVHTYVRQLLRKLGVSGRNGLISLWLGRPA
ncbi:LuxR C-terminal-related transcriptional regulator [Synoicihabitans lomoniglobus]|uniref:LuxR C-terminal-related transcriptional regulator n=1 Tax=Synoicihabitans lomoniglobus TaxID=2909285 RepID=A0AAF0CQH5_9BACT|nr:LuxR C-terminal-related transcriptional regulator [Opitutaceae bacterium LMO-M01]